MGAALLSSLQDGCEQNKPLRFSLSPPTYLSLNTPKPLPASLFLPSLLRSPALPLHSLPFVVARPFCRTCCGQALLQDLAGCSQALLQDLEPPPQALHLVLEMHL